MLDNRPLMFDEFQKKLHQTIYVSATPGTWELEQTKGEIVEQIIRPTGLLDPVIEVVPARNQVVHLLRRLPRLSNWKPCSCHHFNKETSRRSLQLFSRTECPLPMAPQ